MSRKRRPTEVPLPPPGRMALSLEEVAALTGLSLTSIRHAVQAGKLKVHRLGARVIARRVDVDSFLTALPQGFQTRKAG